MDDAPARPTQPGSPDAPESARPPLSTRRKLLFLLATVVIGLLVAEGIARVYYRIRDGRWSIPDRYLNRYETLYQPHIHLGWTLRPNARYEKRGKVVESNSLCYRSHEIDMPKPPGRIRIVCLGGSTTFDVQASNNSMTWPGRLEALVKERRPDLDIDVVNAGFPGYDTGISMMNLGLRALDVDPDLVIVYHAINDLTQAQMPGFKSDYTHVRQGGRAQEIERGLFGGLLQNSLLFVKLERVMRKQARREHAESWAEPGDPVTLPDAARYTYRRNLTSIAGICKAHGIELAIGTFATQFDQFAEPTPPEFACAYTPNFAPEELQRSLRVYADIVRDVAEEQGAHVIEAQKLMPKGEIFADFMHLNDQGTPIMARVVFEELERQGVWDKLAARAAARSDEK